MAFIVSMVGCHAVALIWCVWMYRKQRANFDRVSAELNWHRAEPIRRQQQACDEGFRSAALNIGLGSMACSREEMIRRQGIGIARNSPVKKPSPYRYC